MIIKIVGRPVFTVLIFHLALLKLSALNTTNVNQQMVVTPSVTTFMKDVYNAENQNWDVSSSDKGVVYFANSLGLLAYDGENWELHNTDNILRSVHCIGDTIYVGGNGIMGYYIESENLSTFYSLSNIQSDIWKIYSFDEDVVFQSFNRYFYLDTNGRISIERIAEGNTSYSYPLDNEIFYQVNYGALFALKPNKSSRQIIDDTILSKYMVNYISKLEQNKYLIGTRNNGLFFIENNELRPFNGELNELLKRYKINRAIHLKDDTYVFGTLDGGLIVANLSGEIKYVLNQKNGLANNRVHSLYKQDDSNLWVGTENGISHINIENPLRYLENKNIELGINYDLVEYNGYYYLCTNKGVYRNKVKPFQSYKHNLELVDGTEGHAWSLNVIDNNLFIGHNDASFIIEGDQLRKLSHIAGGYQFLRSKIDPSIIYQSSFYGLAVYKKINQQWNLYYTINNIDGPTRDVIELEDGSLLVSSQYKEAFHVYPDNELKSAQIKDLSKLTAFKNSKWIRAFTVGDDQLLVTNDTSVYYKNEQLYKAPTAMHNISYVSESINNYNFILKNGRLRLYNPNTSQFVNIPYDLSKVERNLIFKYENIRKVGDASFIICLSDGLVYSNIDSLLQHPIANKKTVLTNVEFSNDRSAETFTVDSINVIPNDFNTVTITFSALNYNSDSKYEVFLEGYHTEWRAIKNRNWVKFQNLREGEYKLMIRELGKAEITTYAFVIEPPIFRTNMAYMIYLLIVIVLAWGIRFSIEKRARWSLYKLRVKERKKRNEQLLLRTKELLNTEVKELQSEVSSKTDKLTNLLLQNTKKKEVIDNIKEELHGIKKEQRYVNARHIDKLSRMIKTNIDETKDWLVFEAAFSEAHQNFFKRLKEKHPKLTPEDLKLCAYLKVNLSSKELAPIFKITIRSVDLKIYRLKKKMDLQKDVKLKEYIQNFN